ncbi:MAG: ABC transporter permease [Evtepia gabavorous]
MKRQKTLLSPGGWTALLLLLALGLWEATAAAGYVDPFFFSRPSLLWQEFWTMLHSGMLARHLSVTAQEAGLGLLLGGTLGTLAGLGLGLSPRVSRALMPLMTGLNGLPKLALGPLFIIWFGMGLSSKVLISALMVFFIFAFNLYTGVQSVDPALVGAVRLLGGTQGQILGKVIWPACLPWLLTSLRTGLGLSLSGAIVGNIWALPRHGLAPLRGGGCVQRPAGPLLRADPGDPHHPPGRRGPSVGSPPAALAMSPRSIVSALRL